MDGCLPSSILLLKAKKDKSTPLMNVELRVMRDYDQQLKQGIKEPIFNMNAFTDLNIDAKAWGEFASEITPETSEKSAY